MEIHGFWTLGGYVDIFSDRLKTARKRFRLTQEELAIKAHLPITSIAQFETRKRKPSFDTLGRLALALDVGSDYLLGLTDSLVMAQSHGDIMRNYEKMSADDRALFKKFAELLAERNQLAIVR
jgi:transcriptional regulator with XRE-family HTH domain